MKMEFQGLTYEVMGEGIPIVFLHGLYLDRESTMFFFEPQVRFNGFKRIYIDLPGMGSSIATPSASANSIFDSLKNFIVSIVGQKNSFFSDTHMVPIWLKRWLTIFKVKCSLFL
ncbi:MAG: alpha/beta fold hydrolase [Leuconostoc mesenteroides]|uniref:alpha/beta fold hydrolase n=1 Tax=Leuconostoc mesenteroides TaxID=1245 RepID=UPI00236216A1|nr:alpha/beta hydrolase [Leuconostoc mesenteroides]